MPDPGTIAFLGMIALAALIAWWATRRPRKRSRRSEELARFDEALRGGLADGAREMGNDLRRFWARIRGRKR